MISPVHPRNCKFNFPGSLCLNVLRGRRLRGWPRIATKVCRRRCQKDSIWTNPWNVYVEPMENLWNMATYFPGSVGLVAYLTTRPRFVPRSGGVRETGKRHVFFENRKVTSINTSLILPHWKIWLIFDLKRFSGSLFLFKSIHVRTRGPKTTADFASIYLSFTQRYGMFGMNPHINQNIIVRCWWDRYLKKTQLVAIWTKWVD